MNKKNNVFDVAFNKMDNLLSAMQKNPDNVTESDRNNLEKLYSMICKALGISEHSQWRVEWKVEKWLDTAKKLAGFAPDEIAMESQNIVLDVGATEMLKLITGTGGTAYSNANAYLFVGTDSTAENAAQGGVIATGVNRAYSAMDSGYPTVNGRQMVFRASFGDTEANFAWNEASIANGNGASAVSMNRKVASLGTKTTGTWTLQITVSLTSNT